MKNFGLILIVLGLALAAVPASAQGDACKTSFTLTGKSDNKWYVDGAANPTLTACPGQEITLSAHGEAGVHNIQVTGVDGAPAASDPIDEGSSHDYKFTAPASGSGTYVCQFHSGTMKGTLNFASTGAAPTGNGGDDDEDDDKDSPGVQVLGVTLAMIGAALIIGRRQK